MKVAVNQRINSLMKVGAKNLFQQVKRVLMGVMVTQIIYLVWLWMVQDSVSSNSVKSMPLVKDQNMKRNHSSPFLDEIDGA
jgi:hypothetical protein